MPGYSGDCIPDTDRTNTGRRGPALLDQMGSTGSRGDTRPVLRWPGSWPIDTNHLHT